MNKVGWDYDSDAEGCLMLVELCHLKSPDLHSKIESILSAGKL